MTCAFYNTDSKKYSCIPLDINNPNSIGRTNQTFCVGFEDISKIAINCTSNGPVCLDKAQGVCRKLDS